MGPQVFEFRFLLQRTDQSAKALWYVDDIRVTASGWGFEFQDGAPKTITSIMLAPVWRRPSLQVEPPGQGVLCQAYKTFRGAGQGHFGQRGRQYCARPIWRNGHEKSKRCP